MNESDISRGAACQRKTGIEVNPVKRGRQMRKERGAEGRLAGGRGGRKPLSRADFEHWGNSKSLESRTTAVQGTRLSSNMNFIRLSHFW